MARRLCAPRSPSAWASTSRMYASSSTFRCPSRSRATTRSRAGPAATAKPPTATSSTPTRTSHVSGASSTVNTPSSPSCLFQVVLLNLPIEPYVKLGSNLDSISLFVEYFLRYRCILSFRPKFKSVFGSDLFYSATYNIFTWPSTRDPLVSRNCGERTLRQFLQWIARISPPNKRTTTTCGAWWPSARTSRTAGAPSSWPISASSSTEKCAAPTRKQVPLPRRKRAQTLENLTQT